jgi:hypothetical protein
LVQSKAIAQSIQELESVLGGRLQELAINALVFTHSGGIRRKSWRLFAVL